MPAQHQARRGSQNSTEICSWGTGGDPVSGCEATAAADGLCDAHRDALAALENWPLPATVSELLADARFLHASRGYDGDIWDQLLAGHGYSKASDLWRAACIAYDRAAANL